MNTMAVGEKRIKDIDDSLQKASIVLVDIEGTTTSISFVKDTLFPYIRSNLESYLKAHWKDAEFQDDLILLKEQAKQDETDKVDGAVLIPEGNGDNTMEAVAKNVLWQMDLDRKTKALKQLQGHIMREGYKNGKLKGHVYSDVVPAIKSWAHNGRQIYIYSSGSVEAQKLLFGHSEEGDLLELFAGHFDTEVGPKVESGSYKNIVKKLDCKSEDVVFLTDVSKEAKAAQEAGLKAVLVVREGNAPLAEEDQVNFPVIKSFHDFVFEVSAKRKKMSVDDEPAVLAESTANGPVNGTPGSSTSDKTKAETVKKTDIVEPESSGSGSIASSSDDVEMVDVSNNDAQETSTKTDKETEKESQSTEDTKITVEGGDKKESEKTDPEGVETDQATDDSKAAKTEPLTPKSKPGEAADTEKESPKPCSKNVQEDSGEKVSEGKDTKLKSAEVEVSKIDIDVKSDDSKVDEKEPKGEVASAKAEDAKVDTNAPANEEAKVDVDKAKETKVTDSSTQDRKTELEVTKNDSGDAKAGPGDSEVKSVEAESDSTKDKSEELKPSSGDEKVNSSDVGAAKADTNNAKIDSQEVETDSGDAKADSSNEKTNLEETKVDRDVATDAKVDDSSASESKKTEKSQLDTETEEMETDATEIELDDKRVNADIKDTEKMDTDNITEGKDEITEEMETESSEKLEEKDVALIEKMDMESEEAASVKKEGKNTEPSESLASKESEVIKLESEVTDKTKESEKQSVSASVDSAPSKNDENKETSEENISPKNTEAESKSNAELDTKLAKSDASPEKSSAEESSKEPTSADKKVQDKDEEVSNTVENSNSELPTTSKTDAAKDDGNTNEGTKAAESKDVGKGDKESKSAEETTKENGIDSTAQNGKGDDISNNSPDSEQNGEVKDKDQDVKVKKLSVDGSGNTGKTEDDAIATTPIASS